VTSIGFIGGGRMAEAIIQGLLSSNLVSGSEIFVYDIKANLREYLSKKYFISVEAENQKVASLSEVLILAVKPQNVSEAIKGLEIPKEKLLISIAAGIRLGYLEKAFPSVPIVRVMPNNPALVGAGITAMTLGKSAKEPHRHLAEKIFKSVGEVIMIEEKNMDAVTGLSGSGPAFVYLAIEAMTDAGKKLGLDQKAAQKLALETVLGAARTMKETGKSAKELREMVTSPGGTTIEGLKVLEKRKFAAALREAVIAAARKSKTLSRNLSRS